MNNLYYGFRGDPGQRVPPHPSLSSGAPKGNESNQPVQQSVPTPLSSGLQHVNPLHPAVQQNPLNGSVRYTNNTNNSSSAAIPFGNQHQPWAPDLPSSQSQLLPHHPSLALSHQQQAQQHQQQQQPVQESHTSPVGYQSHQPLRPSALGPSNAAAGGRLQISSRQNTQYDDSMYHMMNKGFQDNPSGINGPHATHTHPDPVLTSRLHQHQQQSQSDLFGRHPQHSQIGGSSAVFDPSEFPTLGGGSRNPATSTSILNSTSIPGSGAFENLPGGYKASLPSAMNGMNPYSDLYQLGGYPSVRGKAVDALTGAGPTAEFSMQSEDFPVLGGGGSDVNAGRSVNTANVTQTGTLDDALRNQNRNHNGSRIIGMERPSNSNEDTFFNVAAQSSQSTKLSQLAQLSGRGQYPGGSTSHLSQASLGMSSQQLSHPITNPAQFDVPSAKAAAQNYLRQEQIAAARQFAQQSKDDLSNLGHRHNVDRMAPSGTTQNLMENSSAQVTANSYLNYGTRERGNLAAFAMPNGPNFDGNTANTATGEDISKINDALTGLQGLSLDPSSRRERMQSSIPASSSLTRTAKGGMGDKVTKGATRKGDDGKGADRLPEADRYGMRGLLKVLNPPAAKAEDVNLLSLGLDLTQLGLDLNSTEPLYKNFRSPWDNYKTNHRTTERETQGGGEEKNEATRFKLPACYYMSPPSLKGSHFGRFQLETLFYIFYSLPKDLLQALAAVELHNRQWRYHKTLKLWFTGAPGSDASYDRGAYIYFDISSWERRPFHDANAQFVQGLMSEDELRAIQIPPHMSNGA